MAWTTEQLKALEMAIALGLEEVEYPDGTRKKFRSADEMKKLRREMRLELGLISPQTGRRFGEHSKGLE